MGFIKQLNCSFFRGRVENYCTLGQEQRQGKSLEGGEDTSGVQVAAPPGAGPGGGALGKGQGEALWSWCLLSAKIVIEALSEHVFPC